MPKSALFFCALFCGMVFTLPAQRNRPNIVFIMSDDHTTQALSCYDGRLNRTPRLDRLAQEGLLFENAFCTNSICSPVRAVNLTGLFSHRNGVLDNLYPFDDSQPTAPKMLRAAGYQTALIGKWHLKSLPTGFDVWQILPDQGEYYNPDFIGPGGDTVRHEGYATVLTTDFALDFLRSRDPQQPFFLMLHHKAPHRNWMPEIKYLNLYDSIDLPEPPTLFDDYTTRSDAARQQEMEIGAHQHLAYDLKVWPADTTDHSWQRGDNDAFFRRLTPAQRDTILAAYAPENAEFWAKRPTGEALVRWKYQRYGKDYLRCVASVDEQVGRVLDFLDSAGLSRNTLVIYTSDQGFYLGEHGWYDKRFMYEESYRQPLLMRWPGVISPGNRTDALVMNLDFVPTFLDLAGLPQPDNMPGRSLRPMFEEGAAPADWRDATYYHYFEYPAVHAVKRHYGIRTKRHKLIHFYYDIDAWELYDLEKDPQEVRNVYEDPDYRAIRDSLHRRLAQQQAFYGDRPEEYLEPLFPDTLPANLAGPAKLTLDDPPEQLYGRTTKSPAFLTDRLFRPFSRYNAGLNDGCGAFRNKPCVVVLELAKKQAIQQVGLHCRQMTQSWFYYPEKVEFFSSDDGQAWQLLHTISAIKEAADGDLWLRFDVKKPRTARYVRIVATPLAVIPAGLPGGGQRGWLLVDEVDLR